MKNFSNVNILILLVSTLFSQLHNEYNIDDIFENGDLLYLKNSKKKVDGKVYKKINNKLMIMGLVNKGKRNGVWKMYFKNGEILKENYSNGFLDGPISLTYSNGQRKWRINYLNGVKNGLSTFWYKNGKKWKEGIYSKEDSIGEWLFWDEKGIIIDKKQYRKLKKSIDFNSKVYIHKENR